MMRKTRKKPVIHGQTWHGGLYGWDMGRIGGKDKGGDHQH